MLVLPSSIAISVLRLISVLLVSFARPRSPASWPRVWRGIRRLSHTLELVLRGATLGLLQRNRMHLQSVPTALHLAYVAPQHKSARDQAPYTVKETQMITAEQIVNVQKSNVETLFG